MEGKNLENRLDVKVNFYREDIAIIELKGELSIFTDEFDLFCREVGAYLKMGIYKFILNMEKVRYIDSSGIGILMRIASTAARKGVKPCYICHQPNVLKVLSISKVDILFKSVESIEEAISYFENI